MDISKIKNRPEEAAGKWFEWRGGRFLVASIKSPGYRNAFQARQAASKTALRRAVRPGATLSDRLAAVEATDANVVETAAEHLLLDWQGVTDGGKPVPYSRAVALELLRGSVEFSDAIIEFASTGFEPAVDEEGTESLKNSSSGSSDGALPKSS